MLTKTNAFHRGTKLIHQTMIDNRDFSEMVGLTWDKSRSDCKVSTVCNLHSCYQRKSNK